MDRATGREGKREREVEGCGGGRLESMLYLHENVFMKLSIMRKKCTHIKTLRERLAVSLLRDECSWEKDSIL